MMKRDGMGLLQLLEYPDVIPSATNFYKLKKTNEHTNSVYSEFSTLKSSYMLTSGLGNLDYSSARLILWDFMLTIFVSRQNRLILNESVSCRGQSVTPSPDYITQR